MSDARSKAPWPDFRGADIYEGDTITHPSGESGLVVFLAEAENDNDAWRVDYGNAYLSRLCLQVGERGRACVRVKEKGGYDLIGKVKAAALFVWDVLIPRFVTEDVAVCLVAGGNPQDWNSFEIVCCMGDVAQYEVFDGIATVDAFQFLGIGFAYRIGNYRPWPVKDGSHG